MKTKELTKLKPRNLLKFFESLYNFKNSKFIVFNDLTDNWGDALNKYLVKEIFDKTPYSTLSTFKPPQKKSYAVIGSILSFHNLNDIEIWGAGLISDNVAVKGKPSKVHALRGYCFFISSRLDCC